MCCFVVVILPNIYYEFILINNYLNSYYRLSLPVTIIIVVTRCAVAHRAVARCAIAIVVVVFARVIFVTCGAVAKERERQAVIPKKTKY